MRVEPVKRFQLQRDFLGAQPLSVAVIGVGGTGAELLSNLINVHLALCALGFGGLAVTAFDPDTVSAANVVRQRYAPSDVGQFKSTTLVHRINITMGLAWHAVPDRFASQYGRLSWDIVISCVDTRRARRQLHKLAFGSRLSAWKFWMDCGNDVSTGQVVLGTPRTSGRRLAHHLPCATELHPELMDDTRDDDTTPSCSALEAISRQDLFVNKTVANLGADLLWTMFRDRSLSVHARYFDLRTNRLAARAVPA